MPCFPQRLSLIAAVAAAGLALSVPAQAQREGHGRDDFHGRDFHGRDFHGRDFHGDDFHGGDFHGGDYGHFSPHDRDIWRGGGWQHGWHDGRFAWWWVADGFWYFYPAPIYPYPTYVPPAIVVQQPPPVPTGLPPAQFWYFCDNPRGYYPYVASCSVAWRQVPATPSK